MKSNYDILGNHIRLIDTRNTESVTDRVLGINIDKFFMPSVANVIGTDLSKYKLITKGKFACNLMHVGRDERLPVALYEEDQPAIVSPAYFMFEIIDGTVLDENYLMMWFRRPEFDRICWLHTDGSVRGGITWDDLCRLELPVPPIEEQRKAVKVYQTITDRIELKKRINDNLADLLQTVYQEQFGDVSSAADKGILSDICLYSRDRVAVSELDVNTYFSTENMLPGKAGATEATSLPTTLQTTACHEGNTLISNIRPYFKKIVYCEDECGCSTDVLCFTPSQSRYAAYLFSTLYADKFFAFMVAGSKGTKMPRGDKQQIMTYPVVLPSDEELEGFNALALPILAQIHSNRDENKRLAAMRDILLPKLISGKLDVSDVNI